MMFDRMPVPQNVARKIQGMIRSGDLAPGARMPSQRELSEQLGVSRASLREGLLTLETLGLVKTEPGRGTFVMERDFQHPGHMAPWRYADSYAVQEVFETRLMVEGRIAALTCKVISGSDIAKLTAATVDMEQAWESQDLVANVEADLSFHALIAENCPNRLLRALYEELRSLISETQRQPIPITQPRRMQSSIAEHRAIIAALKSGDAQASQKAMENHIRNTAACAGVDI